jgi:hypothetical protein
VGRLVVLLVVALFLGPPAATIHIKMNSARLTVPNSHVAVWVGANDKLHDWIQGGIEISYGDSHPWVYLETGHNGKQTKLLRTPTVYGQITTFRLIANGQYWQVITNGKLSPIRIRLNNPTVQIDVEKTYGATVSVSIDGKVQH